MSAIGVGCRQLTGIGALENSNKVMAGGFQTKLDRTIADVSIKLKLFFSKNVA